MLVLLSWAHAEFSSSFSSGAQGACDVMECGVLGGPLEYPWLTQIGKCYITVDSSARFKYTTYFGTVMSLNHSGFSATAFFPSLSKRTRHLPSSRQECTF